MQLSLLVPSHAPPSPLLGGLICLYSSAGRIGPHCVITFMTIERLRVWFTKSGSA
jgi:hypothetical protein